MKNVLITGVNGLIGFEVADMLLQKGYFVYGMSRTNPKIENKNFNFIKADLNAPLNQKELPNEIDVIYHLVQSDKFREFPETSNQVFNVNTVSTLNLLEYARKSSCKKFIYASTGGVYGGGESPFKEDDCNIANGELGFYVSTKLCSELLVENYSIFFDTIISRFFFVYGKRQSKGMLIPRLIENIKNGNKIDIQGKEGLKINPIYVSDAATALLKMLELEGSNKVNIGGSEIMSIKQICDVIGNVLNVEPNYKHVEVKPNHLIGDVNKMITTLHKPRLSFREGVNKLINYTG